jgi:zinc protease
VNPRDLAAERHTLANGLRVVLQRDPFLPLVAVNLWVHVGSKDERPGRTGFAHLFEHMLFQGSAHVGTNDHFRHVQRVGGVANGSTWYDRTNYYETLPASALDLGLWLESDRMGFLLEAMTAEKLDTQRQVVMNERRQRVDNQPYGRALERLHELLYPADHPYHWPVIGYMDDIAAATLADVEEFFRTHYVPANTVLTLAGDLDPDDALRRVERYFGEIPGGPPPPRPAPPPLPAATAAREVLPDRVELPRVYLGFRVPAYGQDDWYAASLLATALGAGKSSPLYSDLVYRRQLVKDVAVYLYPTELVATFMVVATARPGVTSTEVEEALRRHLERAAEGLPPADVERARSRVLTSYWEELEALDRRADLLSQHTTFFDRPQHVETELAIYRQLTAADLAEAAASHCRTDRAVAVTVEPAADSGGGA